MSNQLKPRESWLHSRLRHLCGSYLSVSDLRWILTDKLNANRAFLFEGNQLEYFFHSYNNFRLSERALEIPIIDYFLRQHDYQEILEIGNVTNHYYEYFRKAFADKRKTVVDKFERGQGVLNYDIAEYAPGVKFDFVFSISTFEHMDSDRGMSPDYVAGSSRLVSVAADNIKHVGDMLLKDRGIFVVTAPIGYAPEWDMTFYSDVFEKCNFSRVRKYLFKRKDEVLWEQTKVEEGRRATPISSIPFIEFLSIVEFEK
ncbi:MAG: hypothetical protein ACXW3C_02035 [Pyrinomonadaceae bacterium]